MVVSLLLRSVLKRIVNWTLQSINQSIKFIISVAQLQDRFHEMIVIGSTENAGTRNDGRNIMHNKLREYYFIRKHSHKQ